MTAEVEAGYACWTCADYLRHRRDVLALNIAASARRQGRDAVDVAREFVAAAHQRHLDGHPLREGGPIRVTDPALGRLAALMASVAPLGTPESTA